MMKIENITTEQEFDSFAGKSEGINIVKIGASWCFPCKVLEQTICNLSNETLPDVTFGEVDAEELESICDKYGIRNLPVLLFFKKGELVDKTVGPMNASAICNKVDEIRAK